MPITAAVVGDLRAQAVLATHDMPAKSCRAAALDRRHHLQLAEADVTCIGFTPSGPVVAEDVRDLQGGTSHDRRGFMPAASWRSRYWVSETWRAPCLWRPLPASLADGAGARPDHPISGTCADVHAAVSMERYLSG